ncbi:MAG: YjjG family noncanonical pyrimidine nucleotidase [Sphingobacterium sp.]|uniref:YjjG family noncanonical pyrimidine nucleotidase n=1 Tax=Sphingobacterium sp. JB170 TaxID=1434842 RepID=UPI00097EADB5|nr:YjjG family noncanonical pyrimidine nucleotidase [Sphingobacterium sp. JB170]SJN31442.1 Putative FMN hydrolase; 5-Amino-6-(5'-phosphoribitylamino)uracil phosphatase [Sphingobacterium sp. JB170]
MFSAKKDIFFDLDHTLWDFDLNARETLHELYGRYAFRDLTGEENSDRFIETYTVNNHRLWHLYHHGKIDKETLRKARFEDTFRELGIDPKVFPWKFNDDYLAICPTKTRLFPHAHETLTYLQSRYNLHLISNGFKEACEMKLDRSKLRPYFNTIVISEIVGVNKPSPEIFQFAISNGKTSIENAVMIGDNLDADIRGAQNAGIDAIYFNAVGAQKPDDVLHMVTNLKELQSMF